MRANVLIVISFSLTVIASTLVGCSARPNAGTTDTVGATVGHDTGGSAVGTSLKIKSPHHVMISLADGTALSREQMAYVIGLQDKIASFWEPLPARLKYSVGSEFTVNRAGILQDNITNVSSMGTRKAIQQCHQAIILAGRSPHFDPLPAQFKSDSQTFLCEFVYNPSTASANPASTDSAAK
jgi:hypothetical protein